MIEAQQFQLWRIRDTDRALKNLESIAAQPVSQDLLTSLAQQLDGLLPTVGDPDMVLNNLDRFIATSRSPLATLALFERDPSALKVLSRILSNSQYLSDLLIRDHEAFDGLRQTEGKPVSRGQLVDALRHETAAINDFERMTISIRRFKQRELLRIAFGDLVLGHAIPEVTKQISILADAICQAGSDYAYRTLAKKFGTPMSPAGTPCRYAIFALGKLGGNELNYSSDIDLIFVYDREGQTDTGRRTHRQFFDRLAQDFTRLLIETSPIGTAYRVDWRLRPEGSQGPMTIHAESFLRYYEHKGRSWERQALVKIRPVAGDLAFGRSIIEELQPWIFQSRWSSAEIDSMKALKRKIERRTKQQGEESRNVKTGYGGIRDIEFTIQFLQLLNGSTSQSVRTSNTLEAIDRLEAAGCLTMQEYQILHKNYCWLRMVEHRLQIMFDLQTHTLPEDPRELAKVAVRAGYQDDADSTALDKFVAEWEQVKDLNRGILQHLLSHAFGSEAEESVADEVDLVFDPLPDPEWVESVLAKYHFKDRQRALKNLNALAQENVRFLSNRRCRHFLASITPDLLTAIGATPDPDQTLVNLASVSESIGGKGMLWELFRIHRPSMGLYVKLCAACDYLTSILIHDPGMVDSLMDSLTRGELPSFRALKKSMDELAENAEDLVPILQAFKNDQHLRIGVRDIVGRDSIRATHLALANVAEVMIQCVADYCYGITAARYGRPFINDMECELVILALGKLGGRQPNYHSDLDVVFLYQADGQTRGGKQTTSHQHFFTELGTRIISMLSNAGPWGKMYEIDCRLRPTGKSGALAISFDEFARYFKSDAARDWERLAMCKARPVYGSPAARRLAAHLATNATLSRPWTRQTLIELREMRLRMQENCSDRNLKRGVGGTVDVEFIVQMLQLKHGLLSPEVLQSGTLLAADLLLRHGYLSANDFESLSQSYSFLRNVESRIRLMNTSARHEFPEDEAGQAKLAYLLGDSSVANLKNRLDDHRASNRRLFNHFFEIGS